MSDYNPYPEYKQLDLPAFEARILSFWKENHIFEKSITNREGKKPFVFYEGPPSANGMPGIHHVMARTIKDVFCRFKTLEGFQVKRKAGWDTHGLPVELQVEKELGITKEDIGKSISIEAYNQKCRETVMKYTDVWEKLTEQMGYWVDMQDPYVTYHNDYIETVWYLLKKFYDKDWLYKGFSVQPFSPKAGTGLSAAELNLPGAYKDVTDTSITAQFKIKKDELSKIQSFVEDDYKADFQNLPCYILAWTTTPWTLPANCALAVGEKIVYQIVQSFNPYTHQPQYSILAKDLVSKHFNDKAKDIALGDYKKGDKLIPFQIVGSCTGKDLDGIHYEQLMPYITSADLEKNAFRVILGDFVSTEDGTGIVHTASVFGADDFRVSQQNNVPPVMVIDEEGNQAPLVTRQGRFVDELKEKMNVDLRKVATSLGKDVNEYDLPEYMKIEYEEAPLREGYLSSDVLISILLKEQNKAFKVEKYVHSYPHCWRTNKPILYYPLDSWFIKTTAAKDKLVELNKSINWKPESTGTGRFGNWLENLVDWNLSRQRYWGIPLPIWRTEDGKEEKCIGSVEELKAAVDLSIQAGLMKENPVKDGFDLHRPYIDDIVLVSESGQTMIREKDLIDVWFDSGSMPYAQWHYPFENKELIDNNQFYPADFISEGVDQTRGWFFTLHTIAGMLFDQVAFKNVVSTGLVLDENGEKMAKTKGNSVSPSDVLPKYGADATRWYMVASANPWDNLRFSWKPAEKRSEKIEEVQRRLFGTLYNTYNFYALYANLDKFQINESDIVPIPERTELDRWIISSLQSLIIEVKSCYQNYDVTKAARAIEYFVNDNLSNWYVRLNRKRFWKGEMTTDKKAAYETLHECLMVLAQLMSPIAPFFSDWLYKNMSDGIREKAVQMQSPLQFDSVHLTDLVMAEEKFIDKKLEEQMALSQRISSLTHALRKKAEIRVRQPLQKILIPIVDQNFKAKVESVKEIILSEVNVKEIEYIEDESGILVKTIKPNFKSLGSKYKQQMKEVSEIVQKIDAETLKRIEKEGGVQIGGFHIVLEDLLITSEEVKGLSVLSENGITVALDIALTSELKMEGLARDFVNRVQNFRKDQGFEVQDKISITVLKDDDFVINSIQSFQEYICNETQTIQLQFVDALNDATTIELEGHQVNVSIEVLETVNS